MKELNDIQSKGCPDGIEAIDVSGMDTWVFGVSVLGDETVYRVRLSFSDSYAVPESGLHTPLDPDRWWQCRPSLQQADKIGREVCIENDIPRSLSYRMPNSEFLQPEKGVRTN